MPIVMLLIILVPLAALSWLAYWGYTNQHLWVMALVPGLAAGFFIWAATMVRLPFPSAAIALVIIAVLLAAACWWAYRWTGGAFTRLLAVSAVTVARRPPEPARHAVRLRSHHCSSHLLPLVLHPRNHHGWTLATSSCGRV